ncbi:MAG TPA: MFS transporter [Streptosporangiaceae bacterium]|nr:MFS transporter [Streptosporangiaceae bacterium]
MAKAAPHAPKVPPVRPEAKAATFREVFADSEFRAVWLAEFASIAGDQFARVALTVLVYQRTGSPLLTALTYAASYLPWLIGGLILSDAADRYPRRDVMITADVTRMVLVAAMVIPGMPLWAMIVLLFAVTTLNAPFQGARSALRAEILPGDRYALGLAVSQITREIGVVGGFVAGGVIVAGLGGKDALLIDAATFALSALALWAGVRRRPAPERVQRSRLAEVRAGMSLVFGDCRLRTLMLLGWLAGFYTVAEALAVPYAAHLRHGAVAAGLIFAAGPLGSAVGMAAFTRLLRPGTRLRWMGPLAVAACLVPLACLTQPRLVPSLAIFAVSGLFSAYQVAANAAFVAATPDARRGQAYGLANAGMMLGQGIVYVLAGAAASVAAPAVVVAGSGAVGAAVAGWLALTWRRWSRLTPGSG